MEPLSATFDAELLFSTGFNTNANSYSLIELPAEIAAQFLQAESSGDDMVPAPRPELVIRGLETDEAVICTDTSTYAVRSVQTSNSMLLLRPLDDHLNDWDASRPVYSVQDCVSAYTELTPCLPRLDRLAVLLKDSVYRGPEEEARGIKRRNRDGEEGPTQVYTTESLRDTIQASDSQLQAGLEAIRAVELDGVWRLLDPEYQASILRYLLECAAAEEMPLDRLLLSALIEAMEDMDVPACIVRHALEHFSDSSTDGVYEISASRISRFFGEQLLANAEARKTHLHRFKTQWRSVVPDVLAVDLSMLHGLYLLEDEAMGPTGTTIVYFPKDQLPLDAKARFEMLFQVRKKWTRSDVLPYISDLAPSTKQLDAILLKYGRMSKTGGKNDVVVYTSRYATK
ncbi:Sister chromatid cohesion protein DCC1 [Thoreauomyces humboldtii]|nr:Sister chromatid cohesion protein DCC1 [Thoreauomyces humboldtii]